MSNLHVYAENSVEINASAGANALAALRDAALAALASVGATIERRQTQRYIASLPDHLLRDFGYERDWDGTIRSLRGDA